VPDGFSFLRDGGPLKPSRTIPLLLVSAAGALAFTCAGGLVVYTNTQHLNGTRSWLEHSHSVLTTLQSESQQLDRVGYTMRLYQESGDPDDIRLAQATAAAMEVRTASLQKTGGGQPLSGTSFFGTRSGNAGAF